MIYDNDSAKEELINDIISNQDTDVGRELIWIFRNKFLPHVINDMTYYPYGAWDSNKKNSGMVEVIVRLPFTHRDELIELFQERGMTI